MKQKILASFLAVLLLAGAFSIPQKIIQKIGQQKALDMAVPAAKAGPGTVESAPRFYITSFSSEYVNGGIISLSSTEEPAVDFVSYDVSGRAKIDIYESDQQSVLNYLIYDKDNKQINMKPDTSKMRFVTTFYQDISGNGDQRTLLPIGTKGVWFLNISINDTSSTAFVVRSETGVVVKEGETQFIFWGQDFKTKKSASGGTIKIYNLRDKLSLLDMTSVGTDGIATARYNEKADVAIYTSILGDIAVIPINLTYYGSYNYYNSFGAKVKNTKYFLFTDRTIYKPGDRLYFKSVARDDVEGLYYIPKESVQVSIIKDYDENNPVAQKTLEISKYGTVDGFFDLPKDVGTGNFEIKISSQNRDNMNWANMAYSYFTVDYFRKPEYGIEVNAPKNELVVGDDLNFTISGNYFFGTPLAGQKVKYKVYSGDYYDYYYYEEQENYLSDDYRYGYWYSDTVYEGEAVLDDKGVANVNLSASYTKGSVETKVFSIEAVYSDESQNQSFSRKNILVFPADFGIYKKGWDNYSSSVNSPYTLSLIAVSHRGSSVAGIDFTAKIKREYWEEVKGSGKYPDYNHTEEDAGVMSGKTDQSGNVDLRFTPKKPGSYTISVSALDARGNTIVKTFYMWVPSDDSYYYYYGNQNQSGLSIKLDRDEYQPGDTATLYVSSMVPDSDVLLAIDRVDVNRYQVVSLKGKTAQVKIKLQSGDMPKVFAILSGFSDTDFNSTSQEIKVPAKSKKMYIKITPDKEKFAPGDTATLNIQTTDSAGKGISGELAVWAIDKSLFELMDQKPSSIYDYFWGTRYDSTAQNNSLAGILTRGGAEQGGCFAGDTLVLMSDGSEKNIKDVKTGDYIMSKDPASGKIGARQVTSTHSVIADGYLIVNKYLKVTPNHVLFLNDTWQRAGNIKIGDTLIDSDGKAVTVETLEWQAGKFTVYNLDIDQYHTYFAGGVWVHNNKDGGGSARSIFKDTAYWNPLVKTDASGFAKVSFKLPDNLTTWVVSGIGTTLDNIVGDGREEILVTKDIIARPVLSNIQRVGDDLVVPVLFHNYTDQDRVFNVSMKFDSGDVKILGSDKITIKSKTFEQVFWQVNPKKENSQSSITVNITADDNKKLSDTIISKIPVRTFGFWDKNAENKNNPGTYEIKLAGDADQSKTEIKLTFAPALLGTLPSAMRYLVDYPYGCVEQTTSHFVPALIAKQNPDFYADALKGKDIDEIINAGISRLKELQQSEGGWQWWHDGNSDAFITSYVVEYLVLAKKLGYEVDDTMLNKAGDFLKRSPSNNIDNVSKIYSLTLLDPGSDEAKNRLEDISDLSPDLIAMAAMANARNGYNDLVEKDLSALRSSVKYQGDQAYWAEGKGIYFGSQDSSTAFVAKALLLSGKDRELIGKSVRFLVSHRRGDYWSNTFATSQVIRTVTDLAKDDTGGAVNYSYSVKLDGQTLKTGKVQSIFDSITLDIPASSVKTGGSSLKLEQNGSGQMYSTLTVNQYRTSPENAYASHGLKIKREYFNLSHPNSPIAVGDVVSVRITVEGLSQDQNYGVIEDQLPSGMVPINKALKNEQAQREQSGDNWWHDYYSQENTENGVILSPYYMRGGTATYTYDARAVSAGTYLTPPAYAALMYSPEIYGRSDAQTIKIEQASEVAVPSPSATPEISGKSESVKKPGISDLKKLIYIIVLIVLGLIIRIFMNRKKKVSVENGQNNADDQIPPANNDQTQK